jgi:predicted TIM-barrel fold metal-dependent hydrolase
MSAASPAVELDADGLPIYRHLVANLQWLQTRQEDALEPGLPIVDPHHHLWERDGGYLLDELLADVSTHNVLATVFAQCGYAYRTTGPQALRPVGETERMADIAKEAERRGAKTRVCAGIVGYADLDLGDDVAPVLEAHIEAGDGRFRGIRHISARSDLFNASLLGRPPGDLFYRPGFRRGLKRLHQLGLSFDAWLYHTQIHELTDLARAFPDLPMVLNHVGGPLGIGPYKGKRDEVFGEWHAALKDLSTCPNVTVKLGGLAMAICGFEFHLQPTAPSSQQLAEAWGPYYKACIELFGAKRCMFESNFPVDKAMCSYAVLWNAYKRIAAGASADEKAWLFKETASSVYRI